MTAVTPSAPTVALTAALHAEFAAVYLYGLLGGRASRDAKPGELKRIREGYAAHRLRRDQLLAFLATRGVPTPSPAAAYVAPVDPVSPTSRTACARLIEERCESVYAHLIAAATGPERAFAMSALSATSVAAAVLGQRPSPFPGMVV